MQFERIAANYDAGAAAHLERELHISPLTARLLTARGIADPQCARAFLYPREDDLSDPLLIPGMAEAAGRIKRAVDSGERICVVGDYDVDGISASVILLSYLRSAGANATYYIPSRHADGYGLSVGAVEAQSAAGTKLIVTVDNGIKSVKEIERCYELGMEAVVTDHHIPGSELPRCEAIVTPKGGPCPDISGAGVAFKLVEAMGGRRTAMEYIVLAGLATVADMVPLLGENRTITALALKAVNSPACPRGIRALLDEAGSQGRVSAHTFGFIIAPRLNAAGRMEDASIAAELLLATDSETVSAAARRLCELNAGRQEEEAEIVATASAMAEAVDMSVSRSIVLARSEWNSGIVGIAASRLAEKYSRPVVLFSQKEDILTGSARSVRGLDLHAALASCESRFIRFGGHAYAAGVTMRADELDGFRAELDEYIRRNTPDEVFLPRMAYELDAELSDVTAALAGELDALEPYGEGNPRPLLCTRGASLTSIRRMRNSPRHLSLTLRKERASIEGVFFGAGDRFDELMALDACDLVYLPGINEYRGERKLRLTVRAIAASPPADPTVYAARMGENFIDALSKNILYNDSCAVPPFEAADADRLTVSAVKASVSGTAVLCFTRQGAARLMALSAAEGLFGRLAFHFYANTPDPCAYNAAVLAPELERLDLGRFGRIIVFDTPLSAGLLGAIAEKAPGAKLFVGRQRPEEAKGLIASARLSRDRLGAIFRAIQRLGGSFYSDAEALAAMQRSSGAEKRECALALDVLTELGIIGRSDGGSLSIVPGAKGNLEESRTFSLLSSLGGMNDRFLDLYKEAPNGS